jgi:hypothetical protein
MRIGEAKKANKTDCKGFFLAGGGGGSQFSYVKTEHSLNDEA